MSKEIGKGDQILWVDEKGQGIAEKAEVIKALTDGKVISAYEVKREGERPAAVFRAQDILRINDAPSGLIPLLTRLGAFGGVVTPNPLRGAESTILTPLQALENLSEEASKSGKAPFTLDVKLPPEMLAAGSQKVMGTRFLDPDRQEIGLVGMVTPEGVAKVIIRPDREAHVRQLLASGRMPEASVSGN